MTDLVNDHFFIVKIFSISHISRFNSVNNYVYEWWYLKWGRINLECENGKNQLWIHSIIKLVDDFIHVNTATREILHWKILSKSPNFYSNFGKFNSKQMEIQFG